MDRFLSRPKIDEAELLRQIREFLPSPEVAASIEAQLGTSSMSTFISALTTLHKQASQRIEEESTALMKRANIDRLDMSSNFNIAVRQRSTDAAAPEEPTTPAKRKEMEKKKKKQAKKQLTTLSETKSPINRARQRIFSIHHLDHAAEADPNWRANFVYIGASGVKNCDVFVASKWSIPDAFWINTRDPLGATLPRRQVVQRYTEWINNPDECTLDFSQLAGRRLLCSCPNVYSTNKRDVCHGRALLQRCRVVMGDQNAGQEEDGCYDPDLDIDDDPDGGNMDEFDL